MTNGKHTAIYTRVSTKKQDHRSQLRELKAWAESHDGPVKWYRDSFTGKTMDRPGMTKMLDAMNAGKLDRIVIWRLDRLGRMASGLCKLYDELKARKVDLVSLCDGFNLNSASGRLHARIVASVAEFENEVRSERVRAGIDAARAEGKRWGGRKAGGSNRKTDRKRKAVLDMHRKGEPITYIAQVTGLSRPTIYRVIEAAEAG